MFGRSVRTRTPRVFLAGWLKCNCLLACVVYLIALFNIQPPLTGCCCCMYNVCGETTTTAVNIVGTCCIVGGDGVRDCCCSCFMIIIIAVYQSNKNVIFNIIYCWMKLITIAGYTTLTAEVRYRNPRPQSEEEQCRNRDKRHAKLMV